MGWGCQIFVIYYGYMKADERKVRLTRVGRDGKLVLNLGM